MVSRVNNFLLLFGCKLDPPPKKPNYHTEDLLTNTAHHIVSLKGFSEVIEYHILRLNVINYCTYRLLHIMIWCFLMNSMVRVPDLCQPVTLSGSPGEALWASFPLSARPPCILIKLSPEIPFVVSLPHPLPQDINLQPRPLLSHFLYALCFSCSVLGTANCLFVSLWLISFTLDT